MRINYFQKSGILDVKINVELPMTGGVDVVEKSTKKETKRKGEREKKDILVMNFERKKKST